MQSYPTTDGRVARQVHERPTASEQQALLDRQQALIDRQQRQMAELRMARDERWVTVAEAARLASVSKRSIWNWIQAGKLETKRTVGGGQRIRAGSLWEG